MYTALFNNLTCRHDACQALIYQLVLGLTGENGKYNYSKAVHDYPPFSDNTCSAKNYKIALALTLKSTLDSIMEALCKKIEKFMLKCESEGLTFAKITEENPIQWRVYQ